MDFNKIEQKRRELNLTQGQLATKAGIHVNSYNKIIKLQSTTVGTLEAITKALGLRMSIWWEDLSGKLIENKDPMVNELIQDLLDDKKKLKAQVDELESRLKAYEGKKEKVT